MQFTVTNLHMSWRAVLRLALVGTAALLVVLPLYGQTFTRVTEGAIATDAGNNWGAAWVDYDNDGDLDLYVSNAGFSVSNLLYRNEGDGAFAKISDSIILDDAAVALGTCWADFDNDGDLDVANASLPSTFVYRNDGGGQFEKLTTEALGGATDSPGFSCSWADYNEDGFVDLYVAAPNGFFGIGVPSSLFMNDGDGTFTRITDSPVVMGLAPYTEGTWVDYDEDGDLDLFVGSGPASGTPGPDFLYRNQLSETGTASFTRITDAPLASDRDGQTWNFIDYDNDGDLDGYVTNYSSFPNQLYRNDGGTYVEVTNGPLVTDAAPSLANVWEDFDNDGDLDVVVTNEAGSDNVYYRNEWIETGAATFIRTSALDGTPTSNYGASAGDYDQDGDLDLFIPSGFIQNVGPGGHMLYRNDMPSTNNWVSIQLVGDASNRAGVGANVKAQATIGGQTFWQRRVVSTLNTFNGHSSLDVHFGLGDATAIQTLRIEWPSGTVDVVQNVAPNAFYVAEEGVGFVSLPAYLVEHLMARVDALDVHDPGDASPRVFEEWLFEITVWQANVLRIKLAAALQQIGQGQAQAAIGPLTAFLNQVEALVRTHRLSEEEGRSLRDPAKTARRLLEQTNLAQRSLKTITTTGASSEASQPVHLAQNYPNPFNPATTIAYSLPEAGNVTLKIFDVTGRVVATLVNGAQPAGEYRIPWEAASGLASGAYLYRLDVDGVSHTKVLYLLK